MKDIDIDGASESTHVYGQVSFEEDRQNIAAKIEALRSVILGLQSSRRLTLVYFGPEKCKEYVEESF